MESSENEQDTKRTNSNEKESPQVSIGNNYVLSTLPPLTRSQNARKRHVWQG